MDKSNDFDQVADLYDVYVRAEFDVAFWRQEATAFRGDVLELMCGTGRIGLSLIQNGSSYTGIDYSEGLLDRFRSKLRASALGGRLINADAREFDLGERFNLIFVGFHSLSEVLRDEDKTRLLERVRAHLKPGGRFSFSLYNPAFRTPGLTGERSAAQSFDLDAGDRRLEYAHQFGPASREGIVEGRQFYKVTGRGGHVLQERELEVRFHLISRPRIEALLQQAGFRIDQLWGDYERNPFQPSSPFMIYRCALRSGA